MAPSQTFHDHIVELRHRILWVVLAIGLSAGLGYVLRVRMINILQHPLGAPLFYSSPAGSFNFVLKLSTTIGMFIALPVIIYHILRFIEPALPHRIKKSVMLKIIGSSFFLALAGIGFAFFQMVPLSLKFFAGYSSEAIKPLISADQYLSYIMGNLITFALVFQIPLLVLFINWVKPTRPSQLLKYQRHVIVGAFGVAVILPFTYDPISQFIVAMPIIGLFYVSTIILWIANRRQRKVKRPKFALANTAAQPVYQPRPAVALQPAMMAQAPQPRYRRSMDGFIIQTNRPVIARTPVTNSIITKDITPQRPHVVIKRSRVSLDGIISLPPLSAA